MSVEFKSPTKLWLRKGSAKKGPIVEPMDIDKWRPSTAAGFSQTDMM